MVLNTPASNAPTTCGKLNLLVNNPKSFVLNNINAISNKYLYDIITTPSVWEFIKSIMYIAYLYIFIQFKIYTSFINRKKELFVRLNLLNSSVYNSFNLQNTPAPQRSLLYFTNTIFTLNKSPSTLMLKVPP